MGKPADRERAEKAGFDAHLLKPVDPEVLKDLLGREGRKREGGKGF